MAYAGSIEHLITSGFANAPRDAFAYLYALINSFPNTTVHASYYGNGGTGFDVTGGANPSGDNAWFMWEWNYTTSRQGRPVFGLAQWAYNETLGTNGAPAACGLDNAGLFVSFSAADGGGWTWTGSTNNNGADTKGTPVWDAGIQNLLVFPRANSAGGAYAANREGMSQIMQYNSAAIRWQMYLDDNSLRTFSDKDNTGGYDRIMCFEDFRTRMSGVFPLIMITDNLEGRGLSLVDDYGPLLGNTERDGGVAHPDPSLGVRTFRVDRNTFMDDQLYNPASNGLYYAPRLGIIYRDAQGVGWFGPGGSWYDLRELPNLATHTTTNGLSGALYGSTTQAHTKILSYNHDGVTVPGTGGTAAGVQFLVP